MRIRIPKYPKKPNHSSGQARIRLNKKPIYLGKWNSPESIAKYHSLISHYVGHGTVLVPPLPDNAPSVDELINAHRIWAEKRYVKHGKPTSEIESFKRALRPVHRLYGDTPAKSFGPSALIACRKWMIEQGWVRSAINKHVGRIRQLFKFGVVHEYVKPDVLAALQCVPGLRKGEAHERPKVTTVPESEIDAIKAVVTPTIKTMIDLQLLTGMRPGEVCDLRTCDVFKESMLIPAPVRHLCWLYIPQSHKTEHHDKQRLILLGPKAQEILEPWLRPAEPERYCFEPKETVAFFRAQLRANAKQDWGNKKRSRKKPKDPKRVPSDRYDAHSYANAIAKACQRAKVSRWGPNRLRHNAATLLRSMYGIEVARIILGHSHAQTTLIYAEDDLIKAAKAMSAF